MAATEQILSPQGIDDRVCMRCGREAVSHRLTVSPMDPTVEREGGGLSLFVVQRLGDNCIRDLMENWL